MDALTVLHGRTSVSKLGLPAPTPKQCEALVLAAVRAADHGNLKPWRFLFIEGEGLDDLGEVFVNAALKAKPDSSAAELERFNNMPKRAPMIAVVIAVCHEDHPKVPVLEQIISAGAAAQNLITAAYSMGLGAMWRTGEMAYDDYVKTSLGLNAHEKIVGLIYLGTPLKPIEAAKPVSPHDFFSAWPG